MKHSIIPKSQERGAAVFVVMMAILLLTGLGVWAMRSAGLANAATGYQRAAAQTLFTAELGIVAGTGYLAVPGVAAENYRFAENALHGTGARDDCESIPTGMTAANAFCKNISMADVDDPITTATTFTTLELTNAEGSLGPYASTDASALQGEYMLELTEPRKVLIAGNSVDDIASYKRFTITSYGYVRPRAGNICTGAAGQNATASRLAMRAHAVLGPLN